MVEISKDNLFRLNKVIDFIDDNLDSKINLKQLSDISCFSESHFHRLFQELTGQPPGEFIKRRRMVKSIFVLINRKSLPISSISEICGYSTVSNFSKAFSQYYGVSPAIIKKRFHPHNIKNFNSIIHNEFDNTLLKSRINRESISRYLINFNEKIGDEIYEILRSRKTFSTIKIDTLTYMYSRTFGYHTNGITFQNSIRQFSYINDVAKYYPETKALSVFLDGIDYNQPKHCRFDAGVTVSKDYDEYKQIGKRDIASGLYTTISLQLPPQKLHYIWCYLVAEWIPTTFYELDARPAFCEYSQIPGIPAHEKLNIKYYLPVHIC